MCKSWYSNIIPLIYLYSLVRSNTPYFLLKIYWVFFNLVPDAVSLRINHWDYWTLDELSLMEWSPYSYSPFYGLSPFARSHCPNRCWKSPKNWLLPSEVAQQKNPGAVVACMKQLDWMAGLKVNSIPWSSSQHRRWGCSIYWSQCFFRPNAPQWTKQRLASA